MRGVLELMGGNKVRAAEKLGITRQTLAKRLGETE
jgi:DNA-binding protein Fis